MSEFLPPTSPLILAAAIAIAVGAALLGVFMILRRMALVADAFSHVALPGIAAGLLLHFSPSFGALVMLVIGVFIMEHLESERHVAPETTLGVIFTAALALGLLLIPNEELLESLFGDITQLTTASASLSLVGGLLLTVFTVTQSRSFALLTLSPELAHTSHVSVRRTRLLFFLTVAFAVTLGVQFMGVLLMGALIILPAAIAKNGTPNLRAMFIVATLFAILAAVGGLLLSTRMDWLPGPTVVVVLVALFTLSFLVPKRG